MAGSKRRRDRASTGREATPEEEERAERRPEADLPAPVRWDLARPAVQGGTVSVRVLVDPMAGPVVDATLRGVLLPARIPVLLFPREFDVREGGVRDIQFVFIPGAWGGFEGEVTFLPGADPAVPPPRPLPVAFPIAPERPGLAFDAGPADWIREFVSMMLGMEDTPRFGAIPFESRSGQFVLAADCWFVNATRSPATVESLEASAVVASSGAAGAVEVSSFEPLDLPANGQPVRRALWVRFARDGDLGRAVRGFEDIELRLHANYRTLPSRRPASGKPALARRDADARVLYRPVGTVPADVLFTFAPTAAQREAARAALAEADLRLRPHGVSLLPVHADQVALVQDVSRLPALQGRPAGEVYIARVAGIGIGNGAEQLRRQFSGPGERCLDLFLPRALLLAEVRDRPPRLPTVRLTPLAGDGPQDGPVPKDDDRNRSGIVLTMLPGMLRGVSIAYFVGRYLGLGDFLGDPNNAMTPGGAANDSADFTDLQASVMRRHPMVRPPGDTLPGPDGTF